jgi:hypothetical protein
VNDTLRRGSEPLDAESIIEEEGSNLGAIQKVCQVVIRVRKHVDLALQFVIGRLQFFVE